MNYKKIISAVMCLCMAVPMSVSALPEKTDAAIVVEEVKAEIYDIYVYKNYGSYVEIVATSTTAKNEITVPDKIKGVPVKIVGRHAFSGLSEVTSIILPDSITEIGEQAFARNGKLETVNIPSGVKEIGDEAFLNCASLNGITLPENLKSIGIRAFSGCQKLESIVIPDSVTSLGKQAFDYCTSLASANIPKGITVLDEMTFNGCVMTGLTVPDNVEFIGKQALPKTLQKLVVINPDCMIDEEYYMWNIDPEECVIAAPDDSQLHKFALEYGFSYIDLANLSSDAALIGDVNNDGKIDISDVVFLQRYLLGKEELEEPKLADIYEDGIIDSFDLVLLKKVLVEASWGVDPMLPVYDYNAVNLSGKFEAETAVGAEADEEFIMAQTKFALELMQKSLTENENANTLISPYSVMQALSMTANGANGETLAEMEEALGGISIDKLNEYLYTQRISQPDETYCKLSTANSIWVRDDSDRINVYPEFLQTNKTYYNAESFKAPFDNSTVEDINKWVNEKTDEMIPKIISEIDSSNVAFIINAVAFDAKWDEQYDKFSVSSGKFNSYDGTVQDAEMLNSVEYLYLEDDNAVGIYKYYEGRKYAFAALLPDEGISPADYISGLTPESLNKLLSSKKYEEIECSLPKFSYDYDNDLSNELLSMGMKKAFIYGIADFSKMTGTPIYIDKVLHKTHIELTESGTKAAAVTMVMDNDCAAILPEKSITFDRPFVYFIVDTETSLPVFIGTLTSI